MSRFTVKNLREEIAEINDLFAGDGFSIRYEVGARNGYQAVDEYSVHPDGSRNGSGVNRNICCGSSRECSDAAWTAYYHRHYQASRAGYVD
jgi:hypothetical protein